MSMQQKTILLIIIGILVVAAGAWLLFFGGEASPQNSTQDPADVIARVNDQSITRAELDNLEAQIAQQQGIDKASLDASGREQLQAQTLDALISNALLLQATVAVTVAESDIDAQVETIRGQFSDEAQFQEALSDQGLSEEDLREQVRGEIATQVYLEQVLDLESISVSEEEVATLYEQEAAVSEDVPPLEEVRGQIEAFVAQQKQQELLAAHIQELRADADIEIFI